MIRGVQPILKRSRLKEINEKAEDLNFWLSKTPQERVAAVTSLIASSMPAGVRMDKTNVKKRRLHQ